MRSQNFEQGEKLGGKSIVLFCAACEPNYSNYQDKTNLEIISINELLLRHFKGGRLEAEVDYYPGCFRFRRLITEMPLDISAAVNVLARIEGLKVYHADTNLCCYKSGHLKNLINSVCSNTVITICSGCYEKLEEALNIGSHIKMLPEIVLASLGNNN